MWSNKINHFQPGNSREALINGGSDLVSHYPALAHFDGYGNHSRPGQPGSRKCAQFVD